MLTSRAQDFKALHSGAHPLLVPSVWDVASARIAEDAGATAISVSSVAVGWNLGAVVDERDQQRHVIDLIARIVSTVDIPVSVEIEIGLTDSRERIRDIARKVQDSGALGLEISEGGRQVVEQSNLLAIARRTAPDVFLNARVDTYLEGYGADREARLRAALIRAAVYVASGADGICVPGVTNVDTLAALGRGLPAPLAILVGPGSPPLKQLDSLGIARFNLGATIAQSAYALVHHATREFLDHGTYERISAQIDLMAARACDTFPALVQRLHR